MRSRPQTICIALPPIVWTALRTVVGPETILFNGETTRSIVETMLSTTETIVFSPG